MYEYNVLEHAQNKLYGPKQILYDMVCHYVRNEVAQGRPFGRPTCIPRKYIFYKKSFSQLSSDPTVAILCLNARFTCFWAALCATHIPPHDIFDYNIDFQ